MTYQVLARKWRPRTFAEVVGQEHVVRALSNALSTGRLHHAWLFTGTRGVGKTTLARILAKALNCGTGVTATPCGECPACRDIDAGRFPDLIELDAASHTQVDKMRELLENAQYSPSVGRYKVYIIDEVHMLSKPAFNAMLKTLEEPPGHVKFILATTDPQKIPVTVLSRCLQFNLKPMPPSLVAKHLTGICASEGIVADAEALDLISRAAAGSMRDALSLMDQAVAHGGGRLAGDAARDMLGAVDGEALLDLLDAVCSGDGACSLGLAQAMAEAGNSPDATLSDLAALIHRIALAQTVPDALSEDTPYRHRILELAARIAPELAQVLYQIAILGRRDLPLAPDEYAGFTMTLARMLAFAPADSANMARPAAPAVPAQRPVPVTPPPVPVTREAAPTPAPSPPIQASGDSAHLFDGDWRALLARLKLAGIARELARHCELDGWDGSVLALRVPEVHRTLLDNAAAVERIRNAIAEAVGGGVRVKIAVGAVTGASPAAAEEREREARQAAAVAAIEGDPFVRDLIERFDGEIVSNSIQPTPTKDAAT